MNRLDPIIVILFLRSDIEPTDVLKFKHLGDKRETRSIGGQRRLCDKSFKTGGTYRRVAKRQWSTK